MNTWTAAFYVTPQLYSVCSVGTIQRHTWFDCTLSGDGKLFVLEQKAPVLHKKQQNHHIRINVGYAHQLWRYCTEPALAGLVYYITAGPATTRRSPQDAAHTPCQLIRGSCLRF